MASVWIGIRVPEFPNGEEGWEVDPLRLPSQAPEMRQMIADELNT
jgi:hypothetical protein